MSADIDFATRLTERLGCRYPIISAGMGGPARSELAAAVSAAGGFGLLGMVRESPRLIVSEVEAVRSRTDRPFGVNLIPAATDRGLLDEELDACFSAGVSTICFFWTVDVQAVARAKEAGCVVMHQVGTLDDALAAAEAGVDALIVQGVEAGGHVMGKRPLWPLLRDVAAAVDVPIAASGGLTSGADLVNALGSGAHGVHCGTLFLATFESFAHEYHKQRIIQASRGETVYTDLFAINWPPHSPVRVLANSVTVEAGERMLGHHPDSLPRVVIGQDGGQAIYKFATHSPLRTTTGDLERMPAFAGEGVEHIKRVRWAADVIDQVMADARHMVSQGESPVRSLAVLQGDPAPQPERGER